MSKKALIVVISGLAVIIGVILILSRGEAPPPTATEDLVSVSRPPELGGWQLITHPNFNITFKLPPAWKIVISDNGKGRVESYFTGVVGSTATVNIDQRGNITGLNPDSFIQANTALNPSRINRGSIQGIGYITKETAEDDPSFIEDSYFLVNQYFIGERVINISCGLAGPNYKTMIPTCEEIVKSLQFIE